MSKCKAINVMFNVHVSQQHEPAQLFFVFFVFDICTDGGAAVVVVAAAFAIATTTLLGEFETAVCLYVCTMYVYVYKFIN